jgi:hypothetical protein
MTGRGSRSYICLCLIVLGLSPAAMAQTIAVPDVEELYGAVNNPANAGATLLLSAGTYMLSVNAPGGVPRPNGGRIELQPNMSLRGVEGDRSAVIINAFDLPASSFPTGGGPNAAVRMGLGYNSIEWLTVRDARSAQANIDTGLQSLDPGTAVVRIAHIASTGSVRGLNVLNFGPQTSDQTILAEIVDSHFFDNVRNLSEGVRIGNFAGAHNSTVNAVMTGNLSWGQKQGRLIVNNRAVDSTVNVVSSGNRFYDNGAGTIIVGGLSSDNTRADGNSIIFEAHGDQFVDNDRFVEFDQGGLVVLGNENVSEIGGGSNNVVHVSLWGPRMAGNGTADLTAVGARWTSPAAAGLSENNHVTIEIRGDGDASGKWQPVEFTADTVPAGPSYGNTASVIRY